MPVTSATKFPRLGLGAKIFVAATVSVAAVLGVTLGLTSLQANRTADGAIRRALRGVRRGVQAFLAGRTATFAGMSAVSAEVPQFRERPSLVGSALPRDEVEPALAADTAAMGALREERDSAGTEFAADVAGERMIGLASPLRSAGGDVFGGFVPFRSHDRELAAFRALQHTIGFAVVLGLLLALASAYVLARPIAGPIRRLALATRRGEDA